MNTTEILEVSRETIFVLLQVGAPVMLVTLIVGLAISLIQALTQIQEQTLGFAIKLIAVVVTMVATAPWLGAQMREYTLTIFEQFPMLTR